MNEKRRPERIDRNFRIIYLEKEGMVSSLDILYLVIAFSVLWVAGFICWFVWQVVVIIREVHKTLHRLTFAVDNVEKAVNGVKNKFGTGKLHDHLKEAAETLKEKTASTIKKKR